MVTIEPLDFTVADVGSVLGIFGILGACGTAEVAFGGAGTLIANLGVSGIAVLGAVTISTGFGIDGSNEVTAGTGTAISFVATIACTLGAATETCGFGGGAVSRLVIAPLGRVRWERRIDVGGAKSCPGALAALAGIRLADPLRNIPASVGAGPNLSSTLKSTIIFGGPT